MADAADPAGSAGTSGVWRYLNDAAGRDNPIDELQVYDLRESMANGGGPACLRLRVVLTEEECRR
jgi:succinylarginine dihydrolase